MYLITSRGKLLRRRFFICLDRRNLALATISFAVCFAAWGLISAFAPAFRSELHLTAQSTAFLVAVPVLLGSLARIPMGMLTDRFGGRMVFTCSVPAGCGGRHRSVLAGELQRTRRFCVFPRTCRFIVCRRCRLCFRMVSAGEARHRAGRVRLGEHGPFRGGVPRAGGRERGWVATQYFTASR